jgi:uncharacterized protein (TIGR02145 family)
MKSRKIIWALILSSLVIFLHSCKPEEIILHGEISGYVTDTTTSQPLQAVPVKLNPINDTTSTSSDGKYLFKSLIPGDYTVEVSKPPYAKGKRNADVTSANITVVNFAMHKIPYPRIYPKYLDFGFDSTLKSFTIKNTGTGKLNYSLFPTQDWITVNPNIGEATTETDTFKVTINRTGLYEKKHIESIEVVLNVGPDLVKDTVYVLLNGIIDQDSNYYGIVTIGTQIWMAENLNVGRKIKVEQEQQDNKITEKWCFDCKTYGGLYSWSEMMQYNPQDSGIIGTTQGICPVGWHIPTEKEWITLRDYAGGREFAGGNLRETGTAHWKPPNTGATDKYGFTALPGGVAGRGDYYDPYPYNNKIGVVGEHAWFMESNCFIGPDNIHPTVICPVTYWYDASFIYTPSWFLFIYEGASVRCIKNPPKK